MMKTKILTTLAVLLILAGCLRAQEDAAALEAQYKSCAKHYIPADKCSVEVYRQLAEKDNAPVDPTIAVAIRAIKEYQPRLKNPASMQVRTVYVTGPGARTVGVICLEIAGQNGFGGMTGSRVVFIPKGATYGKHGERTFDKDKWLDDTGILAGLSEAANGGTDRWEGACTTVSTFRTPKMQPGTDITEKVNQELKGQ